MGIYRQMFLLFNKSYAIQNSIVHGNVEINDYYSEEFEVKTMNENHRKKIKRFKSYVTIHAETAKKQELKTQITCEHNLNKQINE